VTLLEFSKWAFSPQSNPIQVMCHLSSNTVHSRILRPYSPSCQVYLNSVPVFPHGGVRLQNRKSKVELSIKSLPSLLFSYVKFLFLKHTSKAVGLSYTIIMAEDCCSFQLISGAGVLNVEGLENFTRTTNLAQRRLSYAAVAVIGPQSSGILATFFLLCTINNKSHIFFFFCINSG
jgi:hypothetical protein